jgi:23S rRNA pseudouridine1911/1915/1917 synthase
VVKRAEPRSLTFSVASEDAGARVEQLLMRALGCSRNEARALCERGLVTLSGKRAKKGDRAAAESEIRVTLSDDGWLVSEPELALDVRLERPDLVVVAKPAGMPSVPLTPGEKGTLVNALIARYPEMCAVGWAEREPGLIHRLDTNTSGLLVAARNADSFRVLVEALRSGNLEKRYLAVVPSAGLAETGTIDAALHPDPSRPGRVRVASDDNHYQRAAHTTFRVLKRGPRWALLEAHAPRAFRHQVRVHLSSIGHPICGDTLYGGESDPSLGARHALHASYVACNVPGLLPFAVGDEAPKAFLDLCQ